MIEPLPNVDASPLSALDPSADNANPIKEVSEQQGELFKKLMGLGVEKLGAVPVDEMLVNQAGVSWIYLTFDYTAKIAGSASQAINKVVGGP